MVEPVVNCVRDVQAMSDRPGQVILTTPQGERLRQPLCEDLALKHERFIVLCGRYEGFDQRVIDILQPMELSIGDYVLNGGEVASMVLMDSLVRLVPGVLGDELSSFDDSFSRGNRILEHPARDSAGRRSWSYREMAESQKYRKHKTKTKRFAGLIPDRPRLIFTEQFFSERSGLCAKGNDDDS